MLPPGLSFNCVSEKALAAQARARLPKSYWAWAPMLAANRDGYFPSTPATNLLYGLRAALDMLLEEGLPRVFDRHARLAGAARAAVSHWGLELWCARSSEYSNTLTAVVMPADFDEAELRGEILRRFDLSLGSGLGKLKGRVFRIGHLGDFNALSLIATLAGVEMGLAVCGVPHQAGGVNAAMSVLAKD
jgi:alanine-glyoxylate transaminase/serine-glyoxylate transaminase/serine-pyruvate transaminase